jgi:hypothetical protein
VLRAQGQSFRSVPIKLQSKEAVMDDRQSEQARMPQSPRYVTERQLRTALDESLWQVERLRVDVAQSPEESVTSTEASATRSAPGTPSGAGSALRA